MRGEDSFFHIALLIQEGFKGQKCASGFYNDAHYNYSSFLLYFDFFVIFFVIARLRLDGGYETF